MDDAARTAGAEGRPWRACTDRPAPSWTTGRPQAAAALMPMGGARGLMGHWTRAGARFVCAVVGAGASGGFVRVRVPRAPGKLYNNIRVRCGVSVQEGRRPSGGRRVSGLDACLACLLACCVRGDVP